MSDHTSFVAGIHPSLASEESSDVCLSKNKSLEESEPAVFSNKNLENCENFNENLPDSFLGFGSRREYNSR